MEADCEEDAAGTPPEGVPGYEFRLETAKLLLDLDERTDTAVRVLEGLIEERDEIPDTWFLLALAHHGACRFKRARECLDHAQEARPEPWGERPPRPAGPCLRSRFVAQTALRSVRAR